MKITKFNPYDKILSLEEEVEQMMVSEFGYVMSDIDKFLDIEDDNDEDDWRSAPQY